MKNYLFINFCFFLFLVSCSTQPTDNIMEINVDLTHRDKVSIYDIFTKVELIPLETNDETLINMAIDLEYYNGVYYLLDARSYVIHAYDDSGKFLFKIDRRGHGPGEYLHMASFIIDKYDDTIKTLDATKRTISVYSLHGEFIRNIKLPDIERAYNRFQRINNDTIVFWTYDHKKRVKYYSINKDKIIWEGFTEDDRDMFCTNQFATPGYLYRSLTNTVYKFTPEGVEPEYRWNFGKYNNDYEKIEMPDAPEETRKYAEAVKNSEIANYVITVQLNNNQYRYAKILRNGNNNRRMHVFYNIYSSKTFIFEQFTEGLIIYPIWMDDHCVIGYLGDNKDVLNGSVLSDDDMKTLENFSEDNNPWLVKYTF